MTKPQVTKRNSDTMTGGSRDSSPAKRPRHTPAHLSSFVNSLSSRDLDLLITLAQERLLLIRGIATLPLELVVYITSFLDIRSLIHCSVTCKAWRELFTALPVVRAFQTAVFPFQDIRNWADLSRAFKRLYMRYLGQGWMEWEVTQLGDVPSIARWGRAESLNEAAKKALPVSGRSGSWSPVAERRRLPLAPVQPSIALPTGEPEPYDPEGLNDDDWEDDDSEGLDEEGFDTMVDEDGHVNAWEIEDWTAYDVSLRCEAEVLQDQRILMCYYAHEDVYHYRFFDTVNGTWYHPLEANRISFMNQVGFLGTVHFSGYFPLLIQFHGSDVYIWNFQYGILQIQTFPQSVREAFTVDGQFSIVTDDDEVHLYKWRDSPDTAQKNLQRRYIQYIGTVKLHQHMWLPDPPSQGFISSVVKHQILRHPSQPDTWYMFSAFRKSPPNDHNRWIVGPIKIHVTKIVKGQFVDNYTISAYNTMHPTLMYDDIDFPAPSAWWELHPLLTEGLFCLGHAIEDAPHNNNDVNPKCRWDYVHIFDLANGKTSLLHVPYDKFPSQGSLRAEPSLWSGINSDIEFFRMDSEACFDTLKENFGDVPPGTRLKGVRPLFFPRHFGQWVDFRQPHDDMMGDTQSVSTLTQSYAYVGRYPAYVGSEEEGVERVERDWERKPSRGIYGDESIVVPVHTGVVVEDQV